MTGQALSISILVLLLAPQGALGQQSKNERTRLLGRSLVCGDYEFRFDRSGAFTMYEDGKLSQDWKANAKDIGFFRNQIVVAPEGAQDTIQIGFRFGNYYYGEGKCVLK